MIKGDKGQKVKMHYSEGKKFWEERRGTSSRGWKPFSHLPVRRTTQVIWQSPACSRASF